MKYIKQSIILLALLLNFTAVEALSAVPVSAATASKTTVSAANKKVAAKRKVVVKKKKKIVVNPWKSVRFKLPESFDADVTAIDGRANQISGKSADGLMIIQITPDTVIKRDGESVPATTISVGDHMKVKGDGQITQSAIVIAKTVDISTPPVAAASADAALVK